METVQAQRGLVLLRIGLGIWFLRSVWANAAWEPWPRAAAGFKFWLADQMIQAAAGHPVYLVKRALDLTVVPYPGVFSAAVLLAHLIVGVSLALGLLTVLGALLALAMSLAFALVTFPLGQAVLGYHLLTALCALVFMMGRAGRSWGLDAGLARLMPRGRLW
jgi:uncharacterized membrane protein YphA (DoxX/SURF4 family)